MQQGSLIRTARKRGPDVWQFRWSEKAGIGKRVYRKRVIGTVDQFSDALEAQRSVAAIIGTSKDRFMKPASMTIAGLAMHFRHHELVQDDGWRSYSTRRNDEFYLDRWIIPRWGD